MTVRFLEIARAELREAARFYEAPSGRGIILMATVSAADSQIHSAIEACVSALRRIENCELEPSLENRLLNLGERKELLSEAEHDELVALVDFADKRTIESLEAKLALSGRLS